MTAIAQRPEMGAFRELVEELEETSAALRMDALNNRLTGAIVVLDGEAPDGLADLLHVAGHAIGLLLAAVEGRTA
jgi:hypothetical protein